MHFFIKWKMLQNGMQKDPCKQWQNLSNRLGSNCPMIVQYIFFHNGRLNIFPHKFSDHKLKECETKLGFSLCEVESVC